MTKIYSLAVMKVLNIHNQYLSSNEIYRYFLLYYKVEYLRLLKRIIQYRDII